MIFNQPIQLDLKNDTTKNIMEKIMDAIEQSPKYNNKNY